MTKKLFVINMESTEVLAIGWSGPGSLTLADYAEATHKSDCLVAVAIRETVEGR